VTKIRKYRRCISAFGGINFVIDLIEQSKIPSLLDRLLGPRVKQATYTYSEIILSWVYANLCGAERLDDTKAIKETFEHRPGFKFPSAERFSDIFRGFATKTETYESQQGKYDNQLNIHMPLNQIMVSVALKLKELTKAKSHTIDYDNVIIHNDKYDSRRTYQIGKGYAPGVLFIDKTPVYIENRNGNSNAAWRISDSVERGIQLLEKNGIKVAKFRSDAAAFSSKVFKLCDSKEISYYIRGRVSQELILEARLVKKWKLFKCNGIEYELASIWLTPQRMGKPQRHVVSRCKSNNQTPSHKKDRGYRYQCIVTNDEAMDDRKVVRFYNQRGSIERNFDDLKNNFNWSRLPFSFLNENTVFLIISAIASIIYRFSLKKFSRTMKFVKRTWRLKNFRFHFINVAAWWEEGVLYIDTEKDYG
jgi:hypothetical protein